MAEQRDEARASLVASPFRLLGQVYDEESGLCWTRFRCFDAETGRWLSAAPLGMAGGLDTFGFDENPAQVVVPLGLSGNPHTFESKLPERLEGELALAKKLGVSPKKVGDPGFNEMANAGPIKWALREDGELVFVPHTVGTREISHSVLSGGAPVLAAGEADLSAGGGRLLATSVTNRSGHFEPSSASLAEKGVPAFRRNGIIVNDAVIEPHKTSY